CWCAALHGGASSAGRASTRETRTRCSSGTARSASAPAGPTWQETRATTSSSSACRGGRRSCGTRCTS
ncbi:unnamed protein product, partial [Prorocentrum cordatum]